jgi:hypothetical protein
MLENTIRNVSMKKKTKILSGQPVCQPSSSRIQVYSITAAPISLVYFR